jgi:predicted  nucleic acid-binding Zn-ribbon protein
MWSDEKQRQLDELRRRAELGALTQSEGQQLTALLAELDHDELEQLRPTLAAMEAREQHLRMELAQLQAEREALIGLAQRYEDWFARARHLAAELRREGEALRAEFKHISRKATDQPA